MTQQIEPKPVPVSGAKWRADDNMGGPIVITDEEGHYICTVGEYNSETNTVDRPHNWARITETIIQAPTLAAEVGRLRACIKAIDDLVTLATQGRVEIVTFMGQKLSTENNGLLAHKARLIARVALSESEGK